MRVSKAIGLMLVLVGGMLAAWFVQQLMAPGPAALTAFIVAAIAVAMLSVGLRYLIKKKPTATAEKKE